MPQSSELAGGDGFTFQDAVTAAYVVALLKEGFAPGTEDRIVTRVALQQRDFGEPLDDLIVDFDASDGRQARLSLQVKQTLVISRAASNADFREIVRDSWETLHKPDFRLNADRYGAVVGEVAAAKARDFRRLCEIARSSPTTHDFSARFEATGNASASVKQIRGDVVALIAQHVGAKPSDEDVHKFLVHFVLIEFDFLHEGSTSQPAVQNELTSCLAVGHGADAPSAWKIICQLVRRESGRSGVFTRQRLVAELSKLVRLAGAPSLRADLARVSALTAHWLRDIEDEIGGTRLVRKSLNASLHAQLKGARVVQIKGLPGSGKSALLRTEVERDLQAGPVLFLKSGRLDGTGWSSFAAANGILSVSLEELLAEIGAVGTPTFYIDGVDRIERQHRPIVKDIISTIYASELLKDWRIVITLRDAGIEPLRNWLSEVFRPEGFRTLEVAAFDEDEADALAEAKPHLRSLLFGERQVREIVRRPFFAKILDQNFGSSSGDASFQPQSEIDLIDNWWARGGYDAQDQLVIDRQRSLIELSAFHARHLDREIAIRQLSPSTTSQIRQLILDGILQDVRVGHTLRFAHDIFFEWAFFHVLVDKDDAWLDEIRDVGEPPAIGRVVELRSQSVYRDATSWAATLKQLESVRMRPQWLRAWLLGPLSAPDFIENVTAFWVVAELNDFHYLKKALVWFQATKTTPNLNVLASDMPAEKRIRFADVLGWPSDLATWQRFISLLHAYAADIPVPHYPNLVAIFEVWQNAFGQYQNPVSDDILELAAAWLTEIDANASDLYARHDAPKSRWEALGRKRKNFRETLVSLLLRYARQRPDLSEAYLQRAVASEDLRTEGYSEIVLWSQVLGKKHASLLVDLSLKHLQQELPIDHQQRMRREAEQRARDREAVLAKPENEHTRSDQLFLASPSLFFQDISSREWDTLAVDPDRHSFFPASPLREPFRSLFVEAPDEALRLLRGLSNHAIACWRQLNQVSYDFRAEPIPLELTFPWGTQTFWGGDQIYLWHRGSSLVPQPLACAYLALETWALDELDKGRPVDELIKQIVVGNDSVAILGVAVAIALQADAISPAVFTLMTSQRLLAADITRLKFDYTDASAGLIGFTKPTDKSHFEAIRETNQRAIRRKILKQLLARTFVMGGELRERAKAAVLTFPSHLPYQTMEEQSDPETTERLRQEAIEFAEVVEEENYQAVKIPGDDKHVAIMHVSPTASLPANVQRTEDARLRLREGNLWSVISEYFDTGKLDARVSVADAVVQGRSSAKLLEEGDDPEDEMGIRDGVVAAVAALTLASRNEVSADDANWARRAIEHALKTPEKRLEFWSPYASIPWHHLKFAAHGLAAELRAGTAEPGFAQNLISLSAHPLEEVSLAAIKDALSLWEVDPALGWAALYVGFSLCHLKPRAPSGPSDTVHSREDVLAILHAADARYRSGEDWPELPTPGVPWIKVDEPGRSVVDGDYVEDAALVDASVSWRAPPVQWSGQYGAKILARIPIEKIVRSDARAPFLEFIYKLLDWTLAKISPPWVKAGHRERHSTDLYEWTHQIGETLGALASLLPTETVRTSLLDPIFSLEDDQCWDLLSPIVGHFVGPEIYDGPQISPHATQILGACLDRVLKAPAFVPGRYRSGELTGFKLPDLAQSFMFVSVERADAAARFANGDWSEIDKILPIIDHFVRAAGWGATIMSNFLTLCERAKAFYPADQFAGQIIDVIERQAEHLRGWEGTALPARIAGLVQHFADRDTPLQRSVGQAMLRILDLLVDMGDRRSAALQLSETFREIQTVGGSIQDD